MNRVINMFQVTIIVTIVIPWFSLWIFRISTMVQYYHMPWTNSMFLRHTRWHLCVNHHLSTMVFPCITMVHHLHLFSALYSTMKNSVQINQMNVSLFLVSDTIYFIKHNVKKKTFSHISIFSLMFTKRFVQEKCQIW